MTCINIGKRHDPRIFARLSARRKPNSKLFLKIKFWEKKKKSKYKKCWTANKKKQKINPENNDTEIEEIEVENLVRRSNLRNLKRKCLKEAEDDDYL